MRAEPVRASRSRRAVSRAEVKFANLGVDVIELIFSIANGFERGPLILFGLKAFLVCEFDLGIELRGLIPERAIRLERVFGGFVLVLGFEKIAFGRLVFRFGGFKCGERGRDFRLSLLKVLLCGVAFKLKHTEWLEGLKLLQGFAIGRGGLVLALRRVEIGFCLFEVSTCGFERIQLFEVLGSVLSFLSFLGGGFSERLLLSNMTFSYALLKDSHGGKFLLEILESFLSPLGLLMHADRDGSINLGSRYFFEERGAFVFVSKEKEVELALGKKNGSAELIEGEARLF